MVENKIINIIEFIGRSTGLKKVNKELSTVTKQTRMTSKILQEAGVKANKVFNFKEIGLDNAGGSFKKINKEMYKFDARMLSTMFFMMALQRIAFSFFRTMFGGMTQVLGDQHAWTIATEKLSASFTFLKFSLIEVLSQSPLFQKLVDWIVKVTQSVGDWVQQHPKITIFMIAVMGVVAAMATLGLALSIIKLGFLATFGKGGIFYVGGMIKLIKKMWGVLLLVNFKGLLTKFIGLMKRMALAIFNGPVLAWTLLIAAILLVVVLFANLKKKFGSLSNAWKIVMAALTGAWYFFIDVIVNSFNWVMNKVKAGFNKLISLIPKQFRMGLKPFDLDNIKKSQKEMEFYAKWHKDNADLSKKMTKTDVGVKSLLDPSVLLDPFKGLFGGEKKVIGASVPDKQSSSSVTNINNYNDVKLSPGADTTNLDTYFNEQNDVFRNSIDKRFGITP